MASSSDIPTVYGGGGPLAHIPDDVTIPQFFLDSHHPLGGEPLLLRKPAWFIDDATGREFTGDQVSAAGFASCIAVRALLCLRRARAVRGRIVKGIAC